MYMKSVWDDLSFVTQHIILQGAAIKRMDGYTVVIQTMLSYN